MNKNYRTVFFNVRRMPLLLSAVGLLAVAGLLALTQTTAVIRSEAKTAAVVKQPDALGRLAFQRLNFFTSGSGNVSLLSVNADGTNQATLVAAGTPPLFCGEPSYSSDGARIAYTQDSDIYVINADGSNKVNITNNGTAASERNPSWSATGKIAYERSSQIWTMNADGSNQAQFLSITQSSPAAPAWSPDGSKLAFASGGEIWVIDADGANERRVTTNATTDADPAWSPDGAKIIFGKGASGIAVVNLDGTNEMNLTNNAADGKPAWSNDGTKIAFVRRTGADGGIFTMGANGANQIRIVADQTTQPGRNENDNPAWQPVAVAPNSFTISGRITRSGASLSGVTVSLIGSTTAQATTNALGEYSFSNLPQGGSYTITPTLANHIFTPPRRIFTNATANQIADFTAGETCSTPNCRLNGRIVFVRGSGIFTAGADGANAVNLTNSGEEPAYSPDGSRIVFRSNRDGNYEIYQMNADGSNQQRLTTTAEAEDYPAYSPDGSKIVFVSSRDGNEEIYTMNAADGSSQQRLTSNNFPDKEPTFSPDGAKIAFSRSLDGTPSGRRAIYMMNAADGTNAQQISTPSSPLSDLTPAYSPDGAKIIFSRYDIGPFTSQFIIVNTDGTDPAAPPVSGNVYKPSYSPDGTKIIYSRFFLAANRYDIEAYPLAGGAAQTLSQNGNRPDWQPLRPAVRRAAFDFDGDGRADVSVFRPSNGVWYRLNTQTSSFAAAQFGIASDKLAPADYDGDGKTDIAVFREGASAYFYILHTADNTFRYEQFGTTGDAPLPGDWDGDGRADLTVYRSGATSNFYYRPSATPAVNLRSIAWGTSGDKAVPADFDGDGKFDAAVFRPSNGTWYVQRSSDNQLQFAQFGIASDVPVPADFDGDGRANFAVFRPSAGTWFTSQNPATNYGAIVFGQAGDVPVAADYDGDGQADAAVYRGGTWYLLRSQAGFTGVAFGATDDKPAPNAFVP